MLSLYLERDWNSQKSMTVQENHMLWSLEKSLLRPSGCRSGEMIASKTGETFQDHSTTNSPITRLSMCGAILRPYF